MRKIVIGLGIFLVVIIAALFIIPSLVPSDVYKTQIETQLSKELGRDVAINGDVSLKTFPFIKAKTEGVSIENPAGFSETPFLSVETLEARIKLLPLLSKRVEISGFELIRPEISLEKRQDGTANWVIASADTNTESVEIQTDGPFQRDGRFTSFDPQIEAFTLTDGRVLYSDASTNFKAELTDIDGFLSLPSLAKTLKMDMAFTYDGQRVEIDTAFNSPRDFLNGLEAPLTATLQTDFANIEIDGRFLASSNLDFTGSLISNVSDFEAVQSLSPKAIPYIELLSKLTANGDVTFQKNILSIKNSDIQITGDGLSAFYKGDATLSETPVLSGTTKLTLANFAGLKPYLPEDMPSLDFMQSVNVSTTLNGTANGFKAQDIIASIKGDGLSASFNGQADYAANKDKTPDIAAKGRFTADITDASNVAKIAQFDSPYAALLGALDAAGNLSYQDTVLSLNGLEATASQGAVNGTYTGELTLAKTPIANGDFTLNIPDLSVVAQTLPEQNAYAQSIKTIKASGKVTTSGDIFTLPVLSANLEDGLINGRFEGNGKYSLNQADALSVQGKLETQVTDLRQLAALGGTELLPDTATGTIFDALSLSGDVNGTTESFTLANAAISFDKINGQGDVTVTLGSQKPFVKANLALDGLDLRPYMASYSTQNPTGKIQPWEESAFNVAPLKAINADFTFTTPSVTLDRLSLQETNMDATLREGLFDANIPALSLYGGTGSVNVTLDTAQTKPEFNMTASLDDVQGNSFLTAIAGFTNATGIAVTKLTLSSSGLSQAEIMKGLNGEGLFSLSSGEIKGIDTSEFLTGLDQAFKTRALPSGIGATKSTPFKEIKGLFSINKGVVTINDFDLSALNVAASGGGTIDLGEQNIDFRFRPRLTGEKANNLAGFGIPLQFSGGFGSAKPTLDTQFLTQIVTERAKAEAASRLKDQVKGPVGDILGGLLGGNTQTSGNKSEGSQTSDTQTTPPQPSAQQELTNVLGGLLGNKTKPSETEKTTPPKDEKKPEEEKPKEEKKDERSDLEKALGGLFGE